jgi:predicted ATPase/class 3 adenylate cyclase
VAICPNCREENPHRARFCLACGTPLEPPQAAAEERKVVSVLFADLVGFTGLSENVDPEDVRSTLSPYFAVLRKEIERFGGAVEKFIGDAVMAVFGAPTTHEDDPERAVRAALRIPIAVEQLNRDRERPLSVRVAVNTGEVLVTLGARSEQGEGMVAGDVVNTASRLQSVAPEDGVVVGEATFRATNAVIDYEPLPPVTLKGKAEPVPLWLAKSARSRFGTDVQQFDSGFVGRDLEQDQLQATFARTLREASVQMVTIVGEPGVGKSRLLSEFSRWVDGRPEIVAWRQGRCLPYGEGITFWSLGEILKAQTGVLESDSPEEAAGKLAESIDHFLGDSEEKDWFRAKLGPLIGLEADDAAGSDRQESFTAWRRFLEAVAAQRPLLLVFEDLHWADDPFLEFVEHLVEWTSGVPILVLCTARPEVYQSHPAWGGGKRNSTTISLSPLSDEETAKMVGGLLDQAVLPAETQRALLDRAGGNPLYAEEFVRMLADRGFLERSGTTVHVRDAANIPLPDSVHALIAARLDTLEPKLKAILYDAAVVGKVFWSGAIVSMGERTGTEVQTALHELVKKEFVKPARLSSVANEDEFSFWHVLIRDVAYGQTPRPVRCQKHQAAAAWIEEVAGDRVRDQSELLAHHYEQALQLAEASSGNEETKHLRESVVSYSLMAAMRAFDLDAQVALAYFRRALDLMPPDDIRRGTALSQMAITVTAAGGALEAIDLARAAIAAFEECGDNFAAAETYAIALQNALHATGRGSESLQAVEKALSLLRDHPQSPELATTYLRLAGYHMVAGHSQETIDWANNALALIDRLDEMGPEKLEALAASRLSPPAWHGRNNMERSRAMSHSFRGIARAEMGDLEGVGDLREAVRILRPLGGDGLSVATINLADFVFWIEGPSQGLEIQRQGIELSTRQGRRHFENWGRAESTWMLLDSGDWSELIQVADQVSEWAASNESPHIETICETYKALVLTHRGQHQEAAALAKEFLPRSQSLGDPQILVPAATASALAFSASGEHDRAADLVDDVVEVSRGRGFFKNKVLPDLVRVMIATGRGFDHEPLFEDLLGVLPRDQNCIVTGRALVAENAGRIEEAEELFRDAADRWQGFGNVFEEANAVLGQARCLLSLGRPDESTSAAAEARRIFSGLGALPSLSESEQVTRAMEGNVS